MVLSNCRCLDFHPSSIHCCCCHCVFGLWPHSLTVPKLWEWFFSFPFPNFTDRNHKGNWTIVRSISFLYIISIEEVLSQKVSESVLGYWGNFGPKPLLTSSIFNIIIFFLFFLSTLVPDLGYSREEFWFPFLKYGKRFFHCPPVPNFGIFQHFWSFVTKIRNLILSNKFWRGAIFVSWLHFCCIIIYHSNSLIHHKIIAVPHIFIFMTKCDQEKRFCKPWFAW